MVDLQNKRNPWKYFLLTFAYSWIIWIPSVLDGLGVSLPFNVAGYSTVVVVIGAFAPLLAAITLIGRAEGRAGIKAFFKRAIDFRTKPIYIIIALALPLVIHIISHYLSLAVGLDVARTLFPDEISALPVLLAIPYFFLMLIIGGGPTGVTLGALLVLLGALLAFRRGTLRVEHLNGPLHLARRAKSRAVVRPLSRKPKREPPRPRSRRKEPRTSSRSTRSAWKSAMV